MCVMGVCGSGSAAYVSMIHTYTHTYVETYVWHVWHDVVVVLVMYNIYIKHKRQVFKQVLLYTNITQAFLIQVNFMK